MGRTHLILPVAVFSLAVGCSAATSSDLYFPTYQLAGGAVPAGDISGVLVLERNCLWIEAGTERYLALWPSDWVLSGTGESAEVLSPGGTSYRDGDEVHFGGGETADQQHRDSLITEPVPEECNGTKAWLVTESL